MRFNLSTEGLAGASASLDYGNAGAFLFVNISYGEGQADLRKLTRRRYSTDYSLRRVDLPVATVTRGASAASYIVARRSF